MFKMDVSGLGGNNVPFPVVDLRVDWLLSILLLDDDTLLNVNQNRNETNTIISDSDQFPEMIGLRIEQLQAILWDNMGRSNDFRWFDATDAANPASAYIKFPIESTGLADVRSAILSTAILAPEALDLTLLSQYAAIQQVDYQRAYTSNTTEAILKYNARFVMENSNQIRKLFANKSSRVQQLPANTMATANQPQVRRGSQTPQPQQQQQPAPVSVIRSNIQVQTSPTTGAPLCIFLHQKESTPSSQTNRATYKATDLSAYPQICKADLGVFFGLYEDAHALPDHLHHFLLPDPSACIQHPTPIQNIVALTAYNPSPQRDNIVFSKNTIIFPHTNIFSMGREWYEIIPNFSFADTTNAMPTITDNNVTYQINPWLFYQMKAIATDVMAYTQASTFPRSSETCAFLLTQGTTRCAEYTLPLFLQVLYALARGTTAAAVTAVITMAEKAGREIEVNLSNQQAGINDPSIIVDNNDTTLIGTTKEWKYFSSKLFPSRVRINNVEYPTRPPNVTYDPTLGLIALRDICNREPLVIERSDPVRFLSQSKTFQEGYVARLPPTLRDLPAQPSVASVSNQQLLANSLVTNGCKIVLL